MSLPLLPTATLEVRGRRRGNTTYGGCSSVQPLYWQCSRTICNRKKPEESYLTDSQRASDLRVSALATGSLLWETRERRRTSSSVLVTLPRCLWDNWNTLRMCSLSRLPVVWAEKTSASLSRAVLVMIGKGNLSMSAGHLTMASHWSPTEVLRRPVQQTHVHPRPAFVELNTLPLSTSIRAELASWRISLLTAASLIPTKSCCTRDQF